jgi:hypothetical protein
MRSASKSLKWPAPSRLRAERLTQVAQGLDLLQPDRSGHPLQVLHLRLSQTDNVLSPPTPPAFRTRVAFALTPVSQADKPARENAHTVKWRPYPFSPLSGSPTRPRRHPPRGAFCVNALPSCYSRDSDSTTSSRMVPRAISSAPRDDRRERSIVLYCPDQGGWQAGAWFDGRWTDFATMTVDLEPTYSAA